MHTAISAPRSSLLLQLAVTPRTPQQAATRSKAKGTPRSTVAKAKATPRSTVARAKATRARASKPQVVSWARQQTRQIKLQMPSIRQTRHGALPKSWAVKPRMFGTKSKAKQQEVRLPGPSPRPRPYHRRPRVRWAAGPLNPALDRLDTAALGSLPHPHKAGAASQCPVRLNVGRIKRRACQISLETWLVRLGKLLARLDKLPAKQSRCGTKSNQGSSKAASSGQTPTQANPCKTALQRPRELAVASAVLRYVLPWILFQVFLLEPPDLLLLLENSEGLTLRQISYK